MPRRVGLGGGAVFTTGVVEPADERERGHKGAEQGELEANGNSEEHDGRTRTDQEWQERRRRQVHASWWAARGGGCRGVVYVEFKC
jgi:hypothetical protein